MSGRPEDIDPGPPLEEIAALREEPNAGFLMRLRDRIQARLSAGHVLDFAVSITLGFLKELGDLVFGLFETPPPRGDSDE